MKHQTSKERHINLVTAPKIKQTSVRCFITIGHIPKFEYATPNSEKYQHGVRGYRKQWFGKIFFTKGKDNYDTKCHTICYKT